MVCPKCCGKGDYLGQDGRLVYPCWECEGSGIVSCCDTAGASEQLNTQVEAAYGYQPQVISAIGTSYLTVGDLRLTDALDRAADTAEASDALKDGLDDFIPVPEWSPWYARER